MVERLPTGIPEVDISLAGGVPIGTWTLLSGPPGSGKTIFTMHAVDSAIKTGYVPVIITSEMLTEEWLIQADMLNLAKALDSSTVIDLKDRLIISKEGDYGIKIKRNEEIKAFIIDRIGISKIAYAETKYRRIVSKERNTRFKPVYKFSMDNLMAITDVVMDTIDSLWGDTPVLLVVDSISMFYIDAPVKAGRIAADFMNRYKNGLTTGYFTAQYSAMTHRTFGHRIEHIFDGLIYMDVVFNEKAKTQEYYLRIQKMRMTPHYKGIIVYDIVDGKGITVVQPSKTELIREMCSITRRPKYCDSASR